MRRILASGAALLLVAAVGCGDDDSSGANSRPASPSGVWITIGTADSSVSADQYSGGIPQYRTSSPTAGFKGADVEAHKAGGTKELSEARFLNRSRLCVRSANQPT